MGLVRMYGRAGALAVLRRLEDPFDSALLAEILMETPGKWE
jgi:hypothetical protein